MVCNGMQWHACQMCSYCFEIVDSFFVNRLSSASFVQCLEFEKAPKGTWRCPWHNCDECGRGKAAAGGQLFHCMECPTAFCFDCCPDAVLDSVSVAATPAGGDLAASSAALGAHLSSRGCRGVGTYVEERPSKTRARLHTRAHTHTRANSPLPPRALLHLCKCSEPLCNSKLTMRSSLVGRYVFFRCPACVSEHGVAALAPDHYCENDDSDDDDGGGVAGPAKKSPMKAGRRYRDSDTDDGDDGGGASDGSYKSDDYSDDDGAAFARAKEARKQSKQAASAAARAAAAEVGL